MAIVFLALTRLGLMLPLVFVATAVAGLLLGGFSLAPRHLVEGMFGYFYLILVLFSGAIYNRWMQESGAAATVTGTLERWLGGRRALLLFAAAALVYVTGMLTGTAGSAVLFAGAVAVPVLRGIGMTPSQAAALITIQAVLGMVAPPVNLPAAMIADGVNMPYAEFDWILLVLSLPLAIVSAWLIGRPLNAGEGKGAGATQGAAAAAGGQPQSGRVLLSFLAVIAPLLIWLLARVIPHAFHDPSVPLVLVIGALFAWWAGRGRLRPVQSAVAELGGKVLELGAILAGVGMLVQVLSLTGVRGWIAMNSMALEPPWTYLAIAVTMPVLGGVLTSLGSASVLGVPFAFIFIDRDMVVNAAALSMMSGLAELMPPTSIAAILSGYLCGDMNLGRIGRFAALPAALIAAVAIAALIFSSPLGVRLR